MQAKSIQLFLLCSAMIFTACSKDKFNSKPQLTFKGVSSTTIKSGDLLQFQIGITDKEGDIQDTLWMIRTSKICPRDFITRDSFKVPDFISPANLDAKIDITFTYKIQNGDIKLITGCFSPPKNDTSTFKFWIRDKKGNISDTITSPAIALLR